MVTVGDTTEEPLAGFTVPTVGEMLAEVAFWIDQLSVEDEPTVICDGLPWNMMITGAVGETVLTVVVALDDRLSVFVTVSLKM